VRRDIPSRTEDQEISKGCSGRLGLGSENAEDRRVDMVFRNRPNIHELLHGILVWHVAIQKSIRITSRLVLSCSLLSVPCHNVEGRVLLLTNKQLAADPACAWLI
jgi:hypothetical protein